MGDWAAVYILLPIMVICVIGICYLDAVEATERRKKKERREKTIDHLITWHKDFETEINSLIDRHAKDTNG